MSTQTPDARMTASSVSDNLAQTDGQGKDRPRRRLVLGSMNVPCDGTNTIAAGPWCFAEEEDFFPYWEDKFCLAPEPLANRALQKRAIAETLSLAADMVPRLAERLCPDSPLPAVYWETLLAPYCVDVARILVELHYRAKAMVEAFGEEELEVELLPDTCTFDMGTDLDVTKHGCLNPACLHWLLSMLLAPMLPKAWHVVRSVPVAQSWPKPRPASFKEELRDAMRDLALRLPCPPIKGLSLAGMLRCSLALCHPSRGEDRSRLLKDHYAGDVTGVKIDLGLDPMQILLTLLPQTIRELEHPAAPPAAMRRPRTRLVHISWYENARYRQKLALWRARGGRLACVQHGGNYGMMRWICGMELVEYTQHAFITWGWEKHESALGDTCGEDRYIPLPVWQLVRVFDSWRGGTENIIFVGTEMPTVGYQMDCHPTPMQNLQYREDKQWFVEALGRDLQKHVLYRPYFPVPGTLDDAPWLISRFPDVHLCSGPLMPHILSCKLLVLDHHGTTLLEAMAANVPVICYWDPACWPVNRDFEDMLLKLGEVGIWHSSAEDAAVHLGKVWQDPAAWWKSAPVQAVRQEFMDKFAYAPKRHKRALWIAALHGL